MKSINKSVFTLGVLALGGMIALAAPASAYDDNHGRDDDQTVRIPYNDTLVGIAIVADPFPSLYDDNHGNNTVVQLATVPAGKRVWAESAAQRSARLAAEEEAQRMRD